jgi:hypothetical protein
MHFILRKKHANNFSGRVWRAFRALTKLSREREFRDQRAFPAIRIELCV